MVKGIWLALVLVAAIAAGGTYGYRQHQQLWSPNFDTPGLVTNERAYSDPAAKGVVTSDAWLVTSGSLFATKVLGFTGKIDARSPDNHSKTATGSAVFRALSRPTDFEDVTIDVQVDPIAMASTPRTGKNVFDGVHVFLRYANVNSLYAITLCRRDNLVVVKKKVPDAASPDGGDYVTLTQKPHMCLSGWQAYQISAVNTSSGVRISLMIGARQVLSVDDRGQGGPALTAPGRVGMRGDNTEFKFSGFRVRRARV